MSNALLENLESKIDCLLENMDLLKLQIEELEALNAQLQQDNHSLKGHQSQWNQGLQTLIQKLERVSTSNEPLKTTPLPEHEVF